MKKICCFLLIASLPGVACAWFGNVHKDFKSCATTNDEGVDTTTKHARNLVAAYAYNDNGVYLCARGMKSWRNTESERPWIWAYTLSGVSNDCYWMCKKGWTGDKCKTAVDANLNVGDMCNATTLSMDDYKSKALSAQVSRPVVFKEWHKQCSGEARYNAYHYSILGVSGFTTDGHGAYVEPMVMRAAYEKRGKKDEGNKGPYIVGSDYRTLVCMIGYMPNDTGDGCVAIDAAACASLCKEWQVVGDLFVDSDQYVRKYDSEKNCMSYACKPGYGFAGNPLENSVESRQCVECKSTETERKTIKPDGQCYTLKTGEVTSATGDGSVIPKVQTKNTPIADMIKNGCWKESDPEEFKKCILDSEGQ